MSRTPREEEIVCRLSRHHLAELVADLFVGNKALTVYVGAARYEPCSDKEGWQEANDEMFHTYVKEQVYQLSKRFQMATLTNEAMREEEAERNEERDETS